MKKIIFIIFLKMSFAQAQEIWLRSPESNNRDFQALLVQKPMATSYSVYMANKMFPEGPNEAMLNWGQNVMDRHDQSNLFSEIESLEANQVMHQEKRNFMIDLLEKTSSKLSKNQQKNIEALICKWTLLSENNKDFAPTNRTCARQSLATQELKKYFPFSDLVMIEDVVFDLSNQAFLPVKRQDKFNWQLLSNSHTKISFYGSFEELIQRSPAALPLIQGTCVSFSHNISDLDLISRGSIYFDPSCSGSLQKPETNNARQWYEKNKSWVVPVGLAVLGAMAYQLKDKKIILEKPSFR